MGFGTSDGQYFDDETAYLSDKASAISIRTAPQGSTEATGALKSTGGTQTPDNSSREENDYDYAGWQAANPGVTMSPGQHYPDTFKLPNHITFSNESQYSTPEKQGGQWTQAQDGSYTFVPSAFNLTQHSPEELKNYFSQYEKGNRLNIIPDFTNDRPHDIVEKIAGGLAHSALNAMALPGDVLSGKVQAGSVQEIERAADLAGLMVAGPAPVASKMADGTLGSFAGVTSKTINKNKLAEAQVMEANATHPDEIWQNTGFFRGADTRWRYEIPDAPAKIKDSGFNVTIDQGLPQQNPSWTNLTGTESLITHSVKDSPRDFFGKVKESSAIRLPDVLDHPELYKAYPALAKTKVQPLPQHLVDQHVQGQFDAHTNTIFLAPELNSDYIKSVLLHEAQHHIQSAENFARGGSSEEFLHPNLDKAEQVYKDAIAKGGDPNSEALIKAKKIIEDEKSKALENYRRLMGEVEARNVQARMDFNQVKRHYNSPRSTEDRPRFSQIPNE